MKKRWISLLLALVLMVGLVPMMAVDVSAAGRYEISNPKSVTGQEIVDEARKWANVNATYWSGTKPWESSIYWRTGYTYEGQTSFDCSGFVGRVLNDCGFRGTSYTPAYGDCILKEKYGTGYIAISIEDLVKYGTDITDAVQKAKNGDYSELLPGDIIGWVYYVNDKRKAHVIIYAGENNGQPWMVEFTGSGYKDRAITAEYEGLFQSGARIGLPVPHVDETYRCYGQLEVTSNTTYVKSMPCSKDTDPESIDVEGKAAKKGDKYIATALYRNTAGNLWYKVTATNGETGYIYARDVKFTQWSSDVSISGVSVPKEHIIGKSFTLEGQITAQYQNLRDVSAWVNKSSGEFVTGYTDEVRTSSYSLKNSAVDVNTKFNDITEEGKYVYYIAVTLQSTYAINATETGTAVTKLLVLHQSTFQSSKSTACSHSYTETVTPPTYEEEGYTTYTCTKCGYSYRDNYTPVLKQMYKVTFDPNGGTLPGPFTTREYASINGERGSNQLIIYNNSGATVDTNVYGVELRVDANHKVIGRRPYLSEAKITVPDGGFVLSGNGSAGSWLETIPDGSYIAYDTSTKVVYAYDSVEAYEANHKQVEAGHVVGLLPEPTREGYIFNGWFLEPDGDYEVTEYFVIAYDVTLYAQWSKEALPEVTVYFDANGGSGGPVRMLVAEDGTLVIPTVVPQKLGYSFLGWGLDADSTSAWCVPGDTIGLFDGMTLYAVWEPAFEIPVEAFTWYGPGISVSFPNEYCVYAFTPVSSGYYDLYSRGEYDTVLEVFDSQGNSLAVNDDGGENYNFNLQYYFRAGEVYYLKARMFGTTTGFIEMVIERRSAMVTKHPDDVSVNAGETATFQVEAIGTGLAYEWYCTADGGSTWTLVSEEPVLSVVTTAEMNGYFYYCVVYDDVQTAYGSAGATLTVIADGWVQENGVWYYYSNGIMQTGWIQINGVWYYLDANGAMQTGWEQVNGTWYYLDASGAMQTGWVKVGGTWYYLDATGAMQTGWVQVGGKWYYLNAGGAMQTGWIQDGGKWYYLNTSGVMQTGWQHIDGKWYYLNSEMKTGWQHIDGKWYYLNSEMKTGWQQIDGKWYYLNSEMKTGWQHINGKWYYLSPEMKTGWLHIGNDWYYLGTNGAMVTGWQNLDGTWYYFDSNGIWIP